MSTRIVIGDERRLFSEAIAATLRLVRDFDVVDVVNDSGEIIPTVLRVIPDVAVLGSGSSLDDEPGLVREMRRAAPRCAVALISADPARVPAGHALPPGVCSVVPDNAGLTHLVQAIRSLVANTSGVDPTVLRQPSLKGRSLSSRETEVLRLTAGGAPVREIAAELFLSPGTVRNLTSSAIKKLGGRNRFDAACIASKRGWL